MDEKNIAYLSTHNYDLASMDIQKRIELIIFLKNFAIPY